VKEGKKEKGSLITCIQEESLNGLRVTKEEKEGEEKLLGKTGHTPPRRGTRGGEERTRKGIFRKDLKGVSLLKTGKPGGGGQRRAQQTMKGQGNSLIRVTKTGTQIY